MNQVDVYCTAAFTLLRHICVAKVDTPIFVDITSCTRKQCVYVGNTINACVYRLRLDGLVSTWKVTEHPTALSVTHNTDVLVICQTEKKLIVLNSDSGDCILEMKVQMRIDHLSHCIQLSDDRYVVAHVDLDYNGRLSQIDTYSRILHRTEDNVALDPPQYMAMDKDGFLFVANFRLNSVVLVDPSLNYVRSVVKQLEHKPESLCFDDAARRLYVLCDDRRSILVVQM